MAKKEIFSDGKSSLSAAGAISVTLKTGMVRGSPGFEAAHIESPLHDSEVRLKSPRALLPSHTFLMRSCISFPDLEELLDMCQRFPLTELMLWDLLF